MKPADFDLATTPLEPGTTCLEASAGTGKTFTISGLVVRLVAERGMALPKILVVTFTEAATEELRDRIRGALQEARNAFSGGLGESSPNHLKSLIDVGEEARTQRIQRLDRALEQFDRSAILTIHGFCRRVLNRTALESGTPFGFETVTDEGPVLDSAFAGYWRETTFAADPRVAGYLFVSKAHERLRRDARLMLQTRDARILPEPASAEVLHQQLDEHCDRFREAFDPQALHDALSSCAFSKKAAAEIAWALDTESRLAFLTSLAEKLQSIDAATLVDLDAMRRLLTTGDFLGGRKKIEKDAAKAVRALPAGPALDQLFETLEHIVHRIRADLQQSLPGLLEDQKGPRQQLSFDDLLLRVRDAARLEDSPTVRVVREDYEAALIDEFQDTDPVQWEIFHRLFGHPDASLFLIGDPKQAIYGFRGADLGTYVEAVGTADRSYTLGQNYRSSKAMVQAVDALFASHRWPFLADIEYHPVTAARDHSPVEGPNGQAALHFVVMKASSQGTKAERAATISIVSQLLEEARLDERPLRPEDCAILCSSRQQILELRQELEQLGIPTRTQGGGDVLESELCDELVALARAMARPRQAGTARRFWASVLGGFDAEALRQLSDDEQRFEREVRTLESAHQIWERNGFASACELLFTHHGTRVRLAREPNASRHLTDLDHLLELFSASEAVAQVDGEALARFVSVERSDEGARAPEERQLRSDGEAGVQVLTMHASKGLEFEVCIVPFLDAPGQAARDRQLQRSRDEQGPVLEPTSEDQETESRAEADSLAERTRLAYVALTRAKRRTIVIHTAKKLSKTSTAGKSLATKGYARGGSPLAHLCAHNEITRTDTPQAHSLQADARRSATRHEIWESRNGEPDAFLAGLRDRLTTRFAEVSTPAELLSFALADDLPEPVARTREIPALVERTSGRGSSAPLPWRRSSFTSITSAAQHGAESIDLLGDQDRDENVDAAPAADVAQAETLAPPSGIHAFASGAAAGLCLHDLLEQIPLFDESPIDEQSVRDILTRHGLEQAPAHRHPQQPAKAFDPTLISIELVERVRNLRLPIEETPQRLCEAEDAGNEWRFVLQGGRSGTDEELVKALTPSGHDDEAWVRTTRSLQLRQGRSLRGYLSGAIDRVIRVSCAYLVVDWKSNRLGNDHSVYRGQALTDAMVEHAYPLQAALYELALHRFLQTRLPDYDPARHLAGSLYVFLRGLEPSSPNSGLWYSPADPERIERLDRILGHEPGRRP